MGLLWLIGLVGVALWAVTTIFRSNDPDRRERAKNELREVGRAVVVLVCLGAFIAVVNRIAP